MVEALNRNQVAWRVANDIEEGAFVNLGVGMPLNVLNYVPEGREIIFHSENGVLGIAPLEDGTEPNPDLINAGKQPISMVPGGAFFHHSDSFAMVRGGHIDVCVLGAYEVGENGHLASWRLPDAKTVQLCPIGEVLRVVAQLRRHGLCALLVHALVHRVEDAPHQNGLPDELRTLRGAHLFDAVKREVRPRTRAVEEELETLGIRRGAGLGIVSSRHGELLCHVGGSA